MPTGVVPERIRSMKRFPIALGVLLLTVACQREGGVEFHEVTFDEALERAAAEDKLVFVDFFTTWCVPCRVMDATTFQDPEVAAWLGEHTVALKVDAEANETNEALAKRFGVRSHPNYVLVSPEGQLLDRLTGQAASAPFIAFGESVLRGETMRRNMEDMLRRGVASSYQVLLGARRDEDAARLAERLINTLDDAETRNALARAGYLTGDPAEVNVIQAREAFDMTGGENLEIVDTLARVLATYGYRDEALEVAQAGLDRATTELERQTMTECLRYCRQSPSMEQITR